MMFMKYLHSALTISSTMPTFLHLYKTSVFTELLTIQDQNKIQ